MLFLLPLIFFIFKVATSYIAIVLHFYFYFYSLKKALLEAFILAITLMSFTRKIPPIVLYFTFN
jgi:hypothetical protein